MIEFVVGVLTGAGGFLAWETIKLQRRLTAEINRYRLRQAEFYLGGGDNAQEKQRAAQSNPWYIFNPTNQNPTNQPLQPCSFNPSIPGYGNTGSPYTGPGTSTTSNSQV